MTDPGNFSMSGKVKTPITLSNENEIEITRDENGVPHVNAQTEADLYFGQGYVQAMDRGMQMLLTRIIGQGRAGEILASTDELLQVDLFFRKLNLYGDCGRQVASLGKKTAALCQAYCQGIDACFANYIPWELKMQGYKPEPWKIEHSILLTRMIAYINLQESQGQIERLLVQMVQAGVGDELLKELFPGKLQGLDRELLKKVKLGDKLVPEGVIWSGLVPRMTASNNWAVAGKRTASGHAILAGDPHLEVNRLPNVWQELVLNLSTTENYLMGASVPGIPGILIGRNSNLSWSATYTFVDAIDSWVEECRGGKYKRKSLLRSEWVRFRERREVIKRKRKANYNVVYYENEHGTLDGDATKEGFYLATRWASGGETGAVSLESVFQLLAAKNVKEGMALFGQFELSFNWVMADSAGAIAYQMSGLVPKRKSKGLGLVPQPGWDSKYDWKEFLPYTQLPRRYNSAEGYFITANNDLNSYSKSAPINVCMGPYRANRIKKLLLEKDKLTGEDMEAIQLDLYSLQAREFMDILGAVLPPEGEQDNADILRGWNLEYTPDSQGAYLFEKFYRELFLDVFGDNGPGREVVEYLLDESGIFIDFYHNFDKILMAEESVWFGEFSREEIFHRALLKIYDISPKKWGADRKIVLGHLMLKDKFPRIFGFNRGPLVLPGGRATPCQGQIYKSGGRVTTFAPSYRMIADMGEEGLRTSLLGGPSDRRFSRLYAPGIKRWLNGEYKRLEK